MKAVLKSKAMNSKTTIMGSDMREFTRREASRQNQSTQGPMPSNGQVLNKAIHTSDIDGRTTSLDHRLKI